MKHLAKIQTEFVKIARLWDELSLDEQRGYLQRHPKSKRRLTAKPGTEQTPTEQKEGPGKLFTKGELRDKATTKQKIKELISGVYDRVRHNKDEDSYTFKRSFFYRHGMTAEKFANAIKDTANKLGLDAEIIDAHEKWHAWPKDSWFEATLKFKEKSGENKETKPEVKTETKSDVKTENKLDNKFGRDLFDSIDKKLDMNVTGAFVWEGSPLLDKVEQMSDDMFKFTITANSSVEHSGDVEGIEDQIAKLNENHEPISINIDGVEYLATIISAKGETKSSSPITEDGYDVTTTGQVIVKFKKKEADKKSFGVQGKYLTMPDGEITSFDSPGGKDVVFQSKNGEKMKVHYEDTTKTTLYGLSDKHDQSFENLDDLATYLNDNKWQYIGID